MASFACSYSLLMCINETLSPTCSLCLLSWGPPANLSSKQLKVKNRRRVLGTPPTRREGHVKEWTSRLRALCILNLLKVSTRSSRMGLSCS